MILARPAIVTPFDFGGLQIRELTSKSLTSASVAQIEVAPSATHAKAKSIRSDKLYLCVAGTVTFANDRQQIQLEPMDVLLIEKNEWFQYHNSSSTTAILFLIHIPPFDLGSEVFED